MTTVEQPRAWVLTKVMAGDVEVGEAAELLGLSVRSVWRLKRRFADEGPAGLVHQTRPRPIAPARRRPRQPDPPPRERARRDLLRVRRRTTAMLTTPTLDKLHALSLGGMVRALVEQQGRADYASLGFRGAPRVQHRRSWSGWSMRATT